MKIKEFMIETFQTVSINGILYSLNTDEKKIYTKVKEAGKLMKSDLNEFDQRIASNMVTKGLLCRRKTPQHEIYFTTKGRRKCAVNKPIEEIAPPDSQIEKWISDNKDKFQEKYGKDYKKYLYGKAWNKFNGKKITESRENNLNETRYESKYRKGQMLKNLFTGEIIEIEGITYWHEQGFIYTVKQEAGVDRDTGYKTYIYYNYPESSLDAYYTTNMDEEYWDGEDEDELNENYEAQNNYGYEEFIRKNHLPNLSLGNINELPELQRTFSEHLANIGDKFKKIGSSTYYIVTDIIYTYFKYKNKIYQEPLYSLKNEHTGNTIDGINNYKLRADYINANEEYWDGEDEDE